MAENSRSKVTITLGRNRQVVKKAGAEFDNSFRDLESTAGRKRSVLDRLGGNIDSSTNKRPRGDGSTLSLSASNYADDTSLNEDDLRLKIMRKNMHKKTQSSAQPSGLDLREMLSRPSQSSTTASGRQHIPERKDAKQHFPEPRDGRQYVSEQRDPRLHVSGIRESRQHTDEVSGDRQYMSHPSNPRSMTDRRDSRARIPEVRVSRQHMAEHRDSRQHIAESRDIRQLMGESRDTRPRMAEYRHIRQHTPERKDIKHHIPEPRSLSITGQIPSTRAAGSLTNFIPSESSYSPWALERLRRRSPDGVVSSSRGFSPLRREEEFQRRPSLRSYDDPREGPYTSKDVIEFSHPPSSASYMSTAALPAGPSKLMRPPLGPPMPPPLVPSMPPVSLLQKSSYAVDDHQTVDSFLYSLDLQKFSINFKAEEVDMYALKQMGDSDLKDLGIPMGPRKKILLALQPRSKRLI